MDKSKIANNFGNATFSYEKHNFIQKNAAKILTAFMLEKFSDCTAKTILDVGAGTGFIYELLNKIYTDARFTLNDISPQMIKLMQNKFNQSTNINYICADIENHEIDYYDLVISNFCLQWVNNIETTIIKLYQNSKIMAVSFLIDGSFEQLHDMDFSNILEKMNYPKAAKVIDLLEKKNPKILDYKIKEMDVQFENFKMFLDYAKKLGAMIPDSNVSIAKLRKMIKTYNKPFTLSYKIIFLVSMR